MPKENRKRGRRGEGKKRKLENGEEEHEQKRTKILDADDESFLPVADESAENGLGGEGSALAEKPFYGMLDDEEQEYFKKADELLELNNFAEPEERALFLANVYREADGKELKIANSQSCSRILERLILLSSPAQLKSLFQKFSGHFLHLVQHRFASHCCETLFMKAAPCVTQELLEPQQNGHHDHDANDDVVVSIENLFLYTINELEGNLGYLLTDRFASHAVRVLLVVLSGEPLDTNIKSSLLRSKKKENIAIHGVERPDGAKDTKRAVPKAFTEALERMMNDSIAGLNTDNLRALATHQLGNPALQLLLKLELTHFGKQRAKDEMSIVRTLLPDDPITEDSGSASFINGLIYDPIGSHLLETIIEFAPGKMFKNLYKEFFRDRLLSMARNDIAGYVVCKILERLSREDLLHAHESILPQIPSLLEKGRIAVIRTLIERCAVRDVDTQALAVQIDTAFAGANGFDVAKLLKIDEVDGSGAGSVQMLNGSSGHSAAVRSPDDNPGKAHGSVLAQAMILVPGPLSGLIFESFTTLKPETLTRIAKDPIASRTLQAALTSTNASIIARRKLVQLFYGHFGDMAVDKAASHAVDAVWEGTHGLAFIRERVAEELAENEAIMRDSPYGRGVWKNWKMDLYKRRRADWIKQSKMKASNDGFQSFSELDINNRAPENRKKTPLDLARERHTANRVKAGERASRRKEPARAQSAA
ncbi:Nucleolar protein 9 [Elasticomyces elasticus]|nr:Nucleolar protein 9 [Elasticomyces elasticus]